MSQSDNVQAGRKAIDHLIDTWGRASQRGAITDQEYCELLEEMQDRASTALIARREELAAVEDLAGAEDYGDPVAASLIPDEDDREDGDPADND